MVEQSTIVNYVLTSRIPILLQVRLSELCDGWRNKDLGTSERSLAIIYQNGGHLDLNISIHILGTN